ncbi:hypothetical protein BTR23_01120 [Alkalihalophilus pseudofirmus]|uniref:DUF1657 domain-containing protein n=1 Tax=Alkalihalobacterium alkalinitrilicum TaxID=427920 RepID=UPI00094CCB5C|nr:DUF1657 domain-containing protein [Alkalihalobacterium alkalinitrilicum]OLO42643.1 hypothetical protein BTR23_01120 [Alkalihalophilus pseudofirmus]
MTVASQVKQCLSTLKGIEASLNTFSIETEDEEARQVFHETCLTTRKVIGDIEKRIGELEREEPQYNGF